MMNFRNEKNGVAALFLLSLLVRLAYVIFLNVNPLSIGQDILSIHDDQGSYWLFAEAFMKDTSWMNHGVSFRPPLYPAFLAIVSSTLGPGKNFLNIMMVQCVISALTVVLVYYIARGIFGRRVAVWTSVWVIIYPLYLYYCGFILRETLVIALFLLFLLSLFNYLKERKRSSIILSGLFFALLVHTDTRYLFYLPFIIIFLSFESTGWRKTLKAYMIFVVFLFIFSFPWAVRNHIAYKDKFVLINTETLDKWGKRAAVNLKKRNNMEITVRGMVAPETLREFEKRKEKAIRFYSEARREGRQVADVFPKDIPSFAGLTSEEEIRAFNNGVRPSFTVLGLFWYNFKEFWRFARFKPDYDPFPDLRFEPAWTLRRNLIGIFFTGLLYPFFIIGAGLIIKKRKSYPLILLLIILVQTLLHVVVHARERYRMPVETLIAMVAFYGISEMVDRLRLMLRRDPK